jgi:hypothetical protein
LLFLFFSSIYATLIDATTVIAYKYVHVFADVILMGYNVANSAAKIMAKAGHLFHWIDG